ncbi:MAG TPA: DUF932 domain-containing protein, partial [Candidatus Limnocylindrales bacterium]
MAHNIARIEGTWQAWYADKPAWHKLGTVTPGARTAKQVERLVPAFRKDIELAPVAARIGGRWIEIEDKRATHRAGDTTVLGIVGVDYEKLTDGDALQVMEAVVNAAKRASFVTAGLLGKGERGFASIDLSRVVNLRVKRDPSRQETHLFADWRHDGTAAMHVGLWNNRVECNNMLDMATAYAGAKGAYARIVHRGDVKAQIEEAQRVLGLAAKVAEAHVVEMNNLASIAIKAPKVWIKGFSELLLPHPTDAGDRAIASIDAARETLAGLWLGSRTLEGVPYSPYRAYQAVAEYSDHHRPLRIGPDTPTEVAADRR